MASIAAAIPWVWGVLSPNTRPTGCEVGWENAPMMNPTTMVKIGGKTKVKNRAVRSRRNSSENPHRSPIVPDSLNRGSFDR